jgi:prepilin-type N-terminal cleavage/methylation domain-containing protein
MRSPRHADRQGFTLIEVLVGIGIFTLAMLLATAAVGGLTRLQRQTYGTSMAASFAGLLGQWRATQMATLAYRYYTGVSLLPSGSVPAITEAEWQASTMGTAAWMYSCDLLTTSATAAQWWNNASGANQNRFRAVGGNAIEALKNAGQLYFVNLSATGGFTGSSTLFPQGGQMDSLSDFILTFQPPPPTPAGFHGCKYVLMTVWSAPRGAASDRTQVTGYSYITARYLGHYAILDSIIP